MNIRQKLHAPTLVKYNFYNQSYKELPPASMDNLFLHFSMDGPMLLKSSKAAQDYMKHEEAKAEALLKMKEEEAAGFEDDQDLLSEVQTTKKNQFDYSDRAAQTFNKTLRDQGFFTEPPPTVTFTGGFTQWKLYDMYMDNYEKKKEMEAREKATKSKKKNANASASIITKKEAPVEKEEEDLIHSKRMGQALKTLERMVNMNANYDIYDDFKYWEDASDQYREAEGTLLPLWRFTDERTKRRTVTSIVWNPQYKDFFAVGYGSYDFMKQRSGMICCYTLKNTSSPEYVFTAPSGVMCMDFHPQHSSLLAVGLYDGTCMVFDVRRKVDKPIYKSTIKSGKHTDPVWQVTWQEEDIAKNMNFFSISLDGTVMNWIMTKSQDLKSELIMELKLTSGKDEAEDEVALTGLAGGTCFDFNKHSEHLFVVGTEEGKIHKW